VRVLEDFSRKPEWRVREGLGKKRVSRGCKSDGEVFQKNQSSGAGK